MNRINRTKAGNYTTIPNVVFKSDLSLRAIGLLTFILHLPNDWILYKNWLYDNMKEGRDAIKTAWKELEAAGYVETIKYGRSENGKFAGTNYIVYDTPVKKVENQPTADQSTATQATDTNPLLSTKKLRTKNKNTVPLSTDVDNGAQVEKEADKPPEQKALPSLFTRFIEVYDRWFKNFHDGVPPKLDGAQGTAAKSLIQYFTRIVNERAKKDGKIYDTVGIEYKVLEAWQYVLSNWHLLDTFLQKKTKLTDISSNAQNIITQIKNGNSKTGNGGSGQKPATGANVSMADIASALNNKFTGPGAKGSQNPGGS